MRVGNHKENCGTSTRMISVTNSTARYFIMGRHTFLSSVPVMAQVANSPSPMGGANRPRPMAITMTVPKWSGLTPSWEAIGVSSGPKIISAGAPSSTAPKMIMISTDNSTNMVLP